ncbi:hypothetical protein Glove_158g131 [Diversispora epigaea]|uniref:Uncharacterized protein n=1 Tax=Diversispora epigaea TaxID=1348612 RepID=A0A397IVB9_9GLOM|nr:hypothetical protein Glove_158g131 [Diversispora epigaea]
MILDNLLEIINLKCTSSYQGVRLSLDMYCAGNGHCTIEDARQLACMDHSVQNVLIESLTLLNIASKATNGQFNNIKNDTRCPNIIKNCAVKMYQKNRYSEFLKTPEHLRELGLIE